MQGLLGTIKGYWTLLGLFGKTWLPRHGFLASRTVLLICFMRKDRFRPRPARTAKGFPSHTLGVSSVFVTVPLPLALLCHSLSHSFICCSLIFFSLSLNAEDFTTSSFGRLDHLQTPEPAKMTLSAMGHRAALPPAPAKGLVIFLGSQSRGEYG